MQQIRRQRSRPYGVHMIVHEAQLRTECCYSRMQLPPHSCPNPLRIGSRWPSQGDTAVAGGFEAWAEAEVARLRTEAGLLETLLARYRETGDRSVFRLAPSGVRRNAPLLLAIEAAGAGGLSLEDVVAAAKQASLGASRANVRSFLWNHVRAGRLALREKRYVAVAHNGNATASSPTVAGDEDTELDVSPLGERSFDQIPITVPAQGR